MKFEVDTPEEVQNWMRNPVPAVFQGQDLLSVSDEISKRPLSGCSFLGCKLTETLSAAAAKLDCLIIPYINGLPFNAFEPGLYSPDELYDQFDPLDPANSYARCLDKKIYDSYKKEEKLVEVDIDVIIARRIHDASIADALDDVIDISKRRRTIAIMGGHDLGRDRSVYRDIALLCQQLAAKGYLIITGGGPGLMEAANLGAYSAGFSDPLSTLNTALSTLSTAPTYKDENWLSVGYTTWKSMGTSIKPQVSQNFSIPTWFYGHEPPNLFATDIAKYFENSIREEGLLAIALAGVVFAEGNGGTVQEIFQDACQNYYKTQDNMQSPMILFGVDYWSPANMVRHNPKDKRKSVYPVLEKLASEKGFSDRLLLTDDITTIVKFIEEKSPIQNPGGIL